MTMLDEAIREALREASGADEGSQGRSSSGSGSSLTERVKNSVLIRRLQSLADDATFYQLAQQLQSRSSLSYEAYLDIGRSDDVPENLKSFFSSPSLFLTLARGDTGHVVTDELLRYIQRALDVESTLLQLLRFSSGGLSAGGFITEKELERYLFRLIPEISGHDKMPPSFYPYYVFTAARRFFFFLDTRRTQRINIKKLGHSSVMEELLYMKRLSHVKNDIDPSQISTNWFSTDNALKLYSTFLDLDVSKSGVLTVEEMLQFAGTPDEPAQLTRVALERIFEANVLYSPLEMDFKAFLDLCLAIENKNTTESLTYFWRAIDMDKTGRLGPSTIEFFYRGVYEALRAVNYDAPSPSNIVIEVFDIVGCNDARGPTFSDIVKSGQGQVVFSLLLDCGGFWNYDNREQLLANQNQAQAAQAAQASSGAGNEEDVF